MKVSIIINEPVQNATGGYKMVYMYANRFVDLGNDVFIYYLCRREKLFSNFTLPFPIKYIVAKILAKKGPNWFNLNKKIKGIAVSEITNSSIGNSDIVIATAVNTAEPVFNLNNEKGKKAYFIQDFENWEVPNDLVYRTYSLGMKNIVVSKWLKETVDRYSRDESIMISNGIDTSIFYNKELDRIPHSIVLQYRKAEYKGPMYAIKAIEKLHKIYPDLCVSIISTEECPEKLPTFCTYHKNVTPEEVSQINNKSIVFICTSINEGFGLPGLEAMACGCVVCSSSYKGVLEYAKDGCNSLLSPIKDVDTMVDNVVKVFEDNSLRNMLINNGLKTATEKSFNDMGNLFINVLNDLYIKG